MAIDQKKYIDIVSGVGGEASASRRELIGRLMTTNVLAPTDSVLEMNLSGVLSYFGSDSDEYKFAVKYFGFISKSITQADKISIARYTPSAVAPVLQSTKTLAALSEFTAVTGGSCVVNLGGETLAVTGENYSGATTYDYIADSLETAIQANTGGGTMWTAATVTHVSGVFTITGGDTGAGDIGYLSAYTSGTDFSALMRLDVGNAPILSVGMDAETPVEALARVDAISDNFGSFSFIETLTNDEITENAAWVVAKNYKYMYSVSVTAANAATLEALIDGSTGTVVTLDAFDDYAEFMPMALFASTNYNRPNSVKNYMYQQFDSESASVTTDADSDTYDALHINYIGATQQAGKIIEFYQDGVMMDAGDIGPYTNEVWLKDAISTSYLNLLLALEQLPANETGESLAINQMQPVITEAQDNGTIQGGKTLTSTQKSYIGQVSGDPDAYIDVQSIGYWLDVNITSALVDEVTVYTLNYVLIYSKGDSVRKVEGSDILI